jgi:undecaprenyl-diphosphatase
VTVANILVLALLQGFTELLPISSSAHLILVPAITGWPDQGLMVDAALHLGTFFAILVYFWRDVLGMLVGLGAAATGQRDHPGAKLALHVVIATIPAVVVGVMIKDYAETSLRSVTLIAFNAIFFGILLFLADRFGARNRKMAQMTWQHAIFVGIAQALALVPGTSRSGITMTAALGLGYDRVSAARFSFLVSLPVTFGGLGRRRRVSVVADRGGLPDELAADGELPAVRGLPHPARHRAAGLDLRVRRPAHHPGLTPATANLSPRLIPTGAGRPCGNDPDRSAE